VGRRKKEQLWLRGGMMCCAAARRLGEDGCRLASSYGCGHGLPCRYGSSVQHADVGSGVQCGCAVVVPVRSSMSGESVRYARGHQEQEGIEGRGGK